MSEPTPQKYKENKIKKYNKFHENMIALMREWYPDRNFILIKDTLEAIYSFEAYDPMDEPTPLQRDNIASHLVTYRVG